MSETEDKTRCPLCGKGSGKLLICTKCYLTPAHLMARAEGLLGKVRSWIQ